MRTATLEDLPTLVHFTAEEAREAEGAAPAGELLEKGIRMALEGDAPASYWLLVDEQGSTVGSVSAVREWSDWNAGYYWWIQSMYVHPAERGKGRMTLLLAAVREAMAAAGGLELRLYVHRGNKAAIGAYKKAGFTYLDYDIMRLKN